MKYLRERRRGLLSALALGHENCGHRRVFESVRERFGASASRFREIRIVAAASVVVNYSSSKEGADRVVADITSQGGKAVAVQANVAQKPDIDRLFAETITAFGRVDVLVNNAGIFDFKELAEVTEEHFHRQ